MPWMIPAAILGGSLISSNAADKAAEGQSAASDAAIAEQRRQYDLSRQDLSPWRDIGSDAIQRIRDLVGLGPGSQFDERAYNEAVKAWESGLPQVTGVLGAISRAQHTEATPRPTREQFTTARTPGAGFTADPGYQFRLSEGNKAIENAAKARGVYMNPATVKELLRYGQDFASGEYNNVYNRFAGIAGLGQNAATTTAGLGAGTAGTIGTLMTNAANARGAAGIAGANAWSNALGQGVNMYNQNMMLKNLFPRGYYDAPALIPGYGG